jgi:hypothetical protein
MEHRPPAITVLRAIVRARAKGYSPVDYVSALLLFGAGAAVCWYNDSWVGWPLFLFAGLIAWIINFGSPRRRLHYMYMQRYRSMPSERKYQLDTAARRVIFVEHLTRNCHNPSVDLMRRVAYREFQRVWRKPTEHDLRRRSDQRARFRANNVAGGASTSTSTIGSTLSTVGTTTTPQKANPTA